MGIIQNSCLRCGKRGGLTKVAEVDGQKIPGSLCEKCGLFLADKQSEMFDVSCDGCKKPMGYAAVEIEVAHVRTVIDKDQKKIQHKTVLHRGKERKKYMCPGCSKKRVEKGEHDVDEVLTRYPVFCMGGCGAMVAYNDHPEGTEAERIDTKIGYCDACTAKRRAEVAKEASTGGTS